MMRLEGQSSTQTYPPVELTPQISGRVGWARKPLGPEPTGTVAKEASLIKSIAETVPSAVLPT